MKSGFSLEEAVREAHAHTRIPGVAAGLSAGGGQTFAAAGVLALGGADVVRVETPFRVASVTKPFTARLCAESGVLDEEQRALLSHTAGLRCESDEPLPVGTEGLWSYSNAGYWRAAARVCGDADFADAMQERVLEPLGLDATGFSEPERPARGHPAEDRAAPADAYPVARRPSGGLWSTVGDLLRFGEAQLREIEGPVFEPKVDSLGERYALGWWVRELADGRAAYDHEGSVAGYQSLLLLVPEDELVLAVLTNSYRGSTLIARLVDTLGLGARRVDLEEPAADLEGSYELGDVSATVARTGDASLEVALRETDPVAQTDTGWKGTACALGGGVYGFLGRTLMSQRIDFPRSGLARIGWVVLPRAAP
jgi:CubicO group peptidase (beta-lactamase class C family)